jgi:hypothetical protein
LRCVTWEIRMSTNMKLFLMCIPYL